MFFLGVSLKIVKHMPLVSLFVLVRSLGALSPRILERCALSLAGWQSWCCLRPSPLSSTRLPASSRSSSANSSQPTAEAGSQGRRRGGGAPTDLYSGKYRPKQSRVSRKLRSTHLSKLFCIFRRTRSLRGADCWLEVSKMSGDVVTRREANASC